MFRDFRGERLLDVSSFLQPLAGLRSRATQGDEEVADAEGLCAEPLAISAIVRIDCEQLLVLSLGPGERREPGLGIFPKELDHAQILAACREGFAEFRDRFMI